MGSIGPMELIIIMVIALLVFGPKKLPEIGRGLGSALREFRRHSRDLMTYFEADDPEPRRVYPEPTPVMPPGDTGLEPGTPAMPTGDTGLEPGSPALRPEEPEAEPEAEAPAPILPPVQAPSNTHPTT